MNTIRFETFAKNQTLFSMTSKEYAAFVHRVFTPKFGKLTMRTWTKGGTHTYAFLIPASKTKVKWMMTRSVIIATVSALSTKKKPIAA